MHKINIIGISGSLRKESYNTSVLKFIKESMSEKINMDIVDISSIPLFNEDLENNTPEAVRILKEKINKCDAVIISTPEYNFSVPGVLKNALDWISRGEFKVMDGKPTAIMSASLSVLGGARVQYSLRNVLLSLNAKVLNRPEVFIMNANEKFDEKGTIIDERTKKSIQKIINVFLEEIKK